MVSKKDDPESSLFLFVLTMAQSWPLSMSGFGDKEATERLVWSTGRGSLVSPADVS